MNKVLLLLLVCLTISCDEQARKDFKKEYEVAVAKPEVTKAPVSSDNTLTAEEKAAGWKLLFDGKTTSSWHGFNKEGIGAGWKTENGALLLDPSVKDGGDIVTDEEFENFEFALDWKIQDCGNSGIMWNVQETKEFSYPWLTGPEMQVLDNKCHPDAKIVTHRAGDLYDMIESSEENVKPAGEWNSIKIVQNNGDVQFWQNGVNVVSFTMHNEKWDEMVANSKFKSMPAFGKYKSGRISLQDHTDNVHFKNIKIKTL